MCLGSIANHIQQLHDSEYVGPIHQSTLLMKYTVGLLLKMVFFSVECIGTVHNDYNF